MGRDAVPERAWRGGLVDRRREPRRAKGALYARRMEMMTANRARARARGSCPRREGEPPAELLASVGVLPRAGVEALDGVETFPAMSPGPAPAAGDGRTDRGDEGSGQESSPVPAALALAQDPLAPGEVHVLHAQAQDLAGA